MTKKLDEVASLAREYKDAYRALAMMEKSGASSIAIAQKRMVLERLKLEILKSGIVAEKDKST